MKKLIGLGMILGLLFYLWGCAAPPPSISVPASSEEVASDEDIDTELAELDELEELIDELDEDIGFEELEELELE